MRQLGDGGFAAGMMAFGEGLQSLEDRLRKRHEDKLDALLKQQGGDWRRAAEVARKDPKLSKSWRYVYGMEPDPEAIPSTYQMTDEEKAEAARIKAGLEATRSQRLELIHRAEQMTGRAMPHEMYTEWAKVPDPYEQVKLNEYKETIPFWGITENPQPFVPRPFESQYPGVGYQMDMQPGSRAARQTAYLADKASQREALKARIRQADERLAFQKEKEETDKKEEEERQKEIRRLHDSVINANNARAEKARRKPAPKQSEEEIKYKVGEISQLTKIDWDNYKSAKKAADDFRSMHKPPSIWPKAAADAEQAKLDKIAADLAKTYQDKVNRLIGVKQSAPATGQPAPATGGTTKRWGDGW